MADDWDPFADPGDVGEPVASQHAASTPAASSRPKKEPEPALDLDLLQPWELEQLDPETKARAEEHGKAVKARLEMKKVALSLPSVAELERELATPGIAAAPLAIPDKLEGPPPPLPKLTKEQALELQDSLISAYWTEEFQNTLHEAWKAAGRDPRKQGKARQEATLPLQVPVVTRYGFEASKRGVQHSALAFSGGLNDDPDVAERNYKLSWLINPDMQAGIVQATGRYLRHSEELVDKAMEGDLAAVQKLCAEGADPNTIAGRVERVKGSDTCCGVAITTEEYTPLIAALFGPHQSVVNALLEHPSLDINVVCHGLNHGEPYKQFSALDVARNARYSATVLQLEKLGARPSEKLPVPPWPRPESLGTPEMSAKPQRPELPPLGSAKRAAPLPAPELEATEAVVRITTDLVATMRKHQCDAQDDRSRLFKQLMLEWHPDKRPETEAETATVVCQWLNGAARCFLAA